MFYHFGTFFALSPPPPQPHPRQPKKSKFSKIEKIPGDITILHMCTKNDNHMMYGS